MPQMHLCSCRVPGTTPSGTKETCSYGAYSLVGGDREETSTCKGAKCGEESVYEEVILWVIRSRSCKNKEQNIQEQPRAEHLPMSYVWLDQLVPISLNPHWHLPLKKNNSHLNRCKVNAYKARQGEYLLEICCQGSAIVTILKNLQSLSQVKGSYYTHTHTHTHTHTRNKNLVSKWQSKICNWCLEKFLPEW